jgi:LIM domain kinase 1
VKEIARGSFGKVYRGTFLGVDVAIKQILRHNDPAYMKYIEREISVLK